MLRVVAAAWLGFVIFYRDGPRAVFLAIALGLVLASLVVRPKAGRAAGAVASSSADRLLPTGKWSGQLSVTRTDVVWRPSTRSIKHGIEEVVVQPDETTIISTERGVGALDLIVHVTSSDGVDARFLTHRNRRLQAALEALT
jgi:hypothetical protein